MFLASSFLVYATDKLMLSVHEHNFSWTSLHARTNNTVEPLYTDTIGTKILSYDLMPPNHLRLGLATDL